MDKVLPVYDVQPVVVPPGSLIVFSGAGLLLSVIEEWKGVGPEVEHVGENAKVAQGQCIDEGVAVKQVWNVSKGVV